MKKARVIFGWLPVALFALVLSCSQEEPQVRIEKGGTDDKEQTGQQLPDVKADRLLVVELKGMVCEKGCGGSIRSELYSSNAVKTVTFEFDEEKTVDVAKVAYDRDKISADEIVAIIAAANEGQFNVIKTRSEAYVDASLTEKTSDASEKGRKAKKNVTIKTTAYASVSTGFFDLFSWI
jgi:arsenate reductase-like glutaredoxin family protein